MRAPIHVRDLHREESHEARDEAAIPSLPGLLCFALYTVRCRASLAMTPCRV